METKTEAPQGATKMEVLAPVAPVDTAFLDLLRLHRGGDCLDELGKALRELNTAIQHTGKGGVLTLKIAVKPANGGMLAVAVKDDIKLSLPKIDKGGSLFYMNGANGLQKDDPNQRHLDLKVVNNGPQDGAVELRRV